VQQVDVLVREQGGDHLGVALLAGDHQVADVVCVGAAVPLESWKLTEAPLLSGGGAT
jgi:hypothetical protein